MRATTTRVLPEPGAASTSAAAAAAAAAVAAAAAPEAEEAGVEESPHRTACSWAGFKVCRKLSAGACGREAPSATCELPAAERATAGCAEAGRLRVGEEEVGAEALWRTNGAAEEAEDAELS
jgi:hypothetical protein